jgi:hypothetical protein
MKNVRYLVTDGWRWSPTEKTLFGNTTQSLLLGTDLLVVTGLSE